MNIKTVTSIILIIFLSVNISNAQKKKRKFGKVSEEELNMKIYDKDSSANAVVLFDIGYSYIEGFELKFERHLRIKILNKEGADEGNIHLQLYNSGSDREKVFSLRGKTFNVENGEIVVTKLSLSDNVLEEKLNDNYTLKKINFPAVKEGSVIDLTYMINSDFLFNLQDWEFQTNIPIMYSEYTTLIPEFFLYHKNLRGYYQLNISEKNETRSITNTNYVNNYTKWIASDIPAFEKEPYITTISDYISNLEFELESFQYPGQPIENFSTSWAKIDKRYTEHDRFGKMMKVNNTIQTMGDEICKDAESELEKMIKIYSHIQEKFAWNSRYGEFTQKNLSKLLNERTGNIADINFLMLRLLRSQGIKANPAILSTRGNGKVYPSHPSYSAFNYMIVHVKIDEKDYYIDATDDDIPLGVLPFKCLNHYGRKFLNNTSYAIDLKPAAKNESTKMYTVKIEEDEDMTGSANFTYKGYAALDKRKAVKNEGGVDQYIKKKTEESKYSSLDDYKISNNDNIYKSYQESFNFSSNENIVFAGNMIYLDPFLFEKIESNPFKIDDRKYPVDYGYLTSKTLIFRYQIPEGYSVSEMPKNIKMSLPQKAASFQFQISVVGQTIQVMSLFKINQALFQNELYSALKNFYNLVIEKQNEKIVLKKNE